MNKTCILDTKGMSKFLWDNLTLDTEDHISISTNKVPYTIYNDQHTLIFTCPTANWNKNWMISLSKFLLFLTVAMYNLFFISHWHRCHQLHFHIIAVAITSSMVSCYSQIIIPSLSSSSVTFPSASSSSSSTNNLFPSPLILRLSSPLLICQFIFVLYWSDRRPRL